MHQFRCEAGDCDMLRKGDTGRAVGGESYLLE